MPRRSTASLPLLAFQHHVGSLYIDPDDLQHVCELGEGALGLVEKGRLRRADPRAGADAAGNPQAVAAAATVVVKSYRPRVVAAPEDFRELLMECGKLAQLEHP